MESRRRAPRSDKPIPEPEPAHVRGNEGHNHDSDDEREATELQAVDAPSSSRSMRTGPPTSHWYDPFSKFWRHQIRISVPHAAARDHLANERTYLAHLRTAVALSMLGVAIAQLYRLEHTEDPSTVFGYYVLGKPIAAIFQCFALIMTLIGTFRFYRQQHAMAVGKVIAAGWEIYTISISMFFLLLGMFAVHVGVDIYKTD